MKTWIKRSLFGLFGASLLVGAFAACAHHRHHHGWGQASEAEREIWRGKMIERAAKHLDLDAVQKAKLATLAQAMAAQRGKVMGETHPAAELQAAMSGPSFDRQRALAWAETRTAALREAAPAVVGAAADFYDSLKPEQQAKLREHLARARHHG